MYRRNLNAPVHALHFNLAGCLRKVTDGFKDTAAQEISSEQCNQEANDGDEEQDTLQMSQESLFRRNRPEEMQLINLTLIHDIHGGMIKRKFVKF